MSSPFKNIPSGWQETRLDRVATVNARIGWKALTAAEYQPDGYVFLATPNIKSAQIDFGKVNYITRQRYEESAELKLREGDVLLAKDGSTLGIVNLVQELPRPATVNGSIAVLRPFAIDPGFLRYVIESDVTQGLIGSVKDGMGVPHLFQRDIRKFPIPLPSLKEQQRIARFLDAETSRVDSLAATQANLREKLSERRTSNVHALVTGAGYPERKPAKLAWAYTVPASWESVKVSFVARMGSGHTPSRSHPEWWEHCDISWITTGEVAQIRNDRKETIYETREKVSRIGLANSAAELHPAGTVVLSRTASAGFSAVMGSDMATSQDYVAWTCHPQLNPYYLLWCLRVMRPDLLQRLAMGSTHKTIYFPDLQSLRIPLPPIDEQQVIVEKIRESNVRVDRLLDVTERQLDLLAERRRALITAAVTGQLDVTTARSGVR